MAACAGAPGEPRAASERRLGAAVAAGLDLYDGGEYVLAARRFRDAAVLAEALSLEPTRHAALTGECLAWLRARRLAELAECSGRLEAVQREQRRPGPGVNTLIAMGAVAGGRPLPALRVPHSVRALLEAPPREALR